MIKLTKQQPKMTLQEKLTETEKAYNAAHQRLFVYRKQENQTKIDIEIKTIKVLLSKINLIKNQIKNA